MITGLAERSSAIHDQETNDASHDLGSSTDNTLLDIRKLLEQQNNILEKLVKCGYEADISLQPLPPVSARTSCAWTFLLTSAIKNAAPIIARWQGGLDTSLIFVGFFSSIVTSFFVDSSKSLRADETVRTNELLMNLTDIILFVSGDLADNLTLPTPAPFVPDPGDARVNMYWSLSLIICISAAAVAMAGRGFLALLVKPEGDAVTKLTELHLRITQAKALLGPFLEALPRLLLLPYILFVVGLLDGLLSRSFSNQGFILPTIISSIFSCSLMVALGILLIVVVTHGILYPRTSPFQTLLSQVIWRRKSVEKSTFDEYVVERDLTNENLQVFHLVTQETFEDEALDQASAALEGIIFDNVGLSASLMDLEIRTILHLLSPEASLRSNLSAARIIVKLSSNLGSKVQFASHSLSSRHRVALLSALRHAAGRHQEIQPHLLGWHQNSLFISAMASLIPSSAKDEYLHPLIALLSANQLPLQAVSTELRKVHATLVRQAISTLTCTLGHSSGIEREKQIHTTLRRLLGPCCISPNGGASLLLSLMYSPVANLGTQYQDPGDYTKIVECINQWLAKGRNAVDTIMWVVHLVLSENMQHEGHFILGSYPAVARIVLGFVLYKTRDLTSDDLKFCVKFILRIQGTFLWDVCHSVTLQIIVRFLDLLEKNSGEIKKEHLGWNRCDDAIKYARTWSVYQASGLRDYSTGSVDSLSSKELLERMDRISKDFLHVHGQDAYLNGN